MITPFNHGEVTIRPVRGQASPYLPIAVDIFREIFPEYVAYVPFLRGCADAVSPLHPATLNHLWLLERSDPTGGNPGRIPIGVRLFCYVPARNLAYGAFVGILPAYRSQGIGAWLVRQTMVQLAADAAQLQRPKPLGYCAEVDKVEFATSEEDGRMRQRRLAFHLRNYAQRLPVDYREPLLPPGATSEANGDQLPPGPKPMHLIFYPIMQPAPLTARDLRNILEAIYFDVYRLPEDTPYVRQALQSIV